MGMRIMDMQVMVQKTGEVAKIQQAQLQENNFRQQEIGSSIVANTNKNTHSVNKPEANEGKLVHDKQEGEKGSGKNKKKKGNSENKENTKDNADEHKQLDPNRGTNLDILA